VFPYQFAGDAFVADGDDEYQVIDPGFDGVIPDMARQYMDRFLNVMSVE